MRLDEFTGQEVVIWGTGTEGRAAFELLQTLPVKELHVIDDDKPESFPGEVLVGEAATAALQQADIIVKSPGVSMYDKRTQSALQRGKRVTNGTAIFLSEHGGKDVIGITGSKGKSTTASLVNHILRALSYKSELAGNIGRSPLELLANSLTGPVVLEVSSFQAANVTAHPEIGVLTALFPEHLDWHRTKENYFRDKLNLFSPQTTKLSVNASFQNELEQVTVFKQQKLYGFEGEIVTDGQQISVDSAPLFKLEGPQHNSVNACGALSALRDFGVDLKANRDAIQEALETVAPLSHRLQPIGKLGGALVIDDGLATAPLAVTLALFSIDGKVALICGGFDRGVPLDVFHDTLQQYEGRVRAFATGAVGEQLNGHPNVELCNNFSDAVQRAAAVAADVDVILLSPGASSFDEFANYGERSQRFAELLVEAGMEPL